MIEFFKQFSQALANFNSIVTKLTNPEGLAIKLDIELRVNGELVSLTVTPVDGGA